MASIIRIKRSQTAGNPGTLGAGELAYSALTNNDSNGGDRLYIGIGSETSGNAVNHYVIGGKYFTDLMDHTRGTLVADSAILVDADKKINELFVNNLKLTGNTISSTDTNGNIILDPNGSGNVIVKTGAKLIVEDLTATRITFVGSANELTDNANLTFSTATNTLGTVNVIATAKVKGADLQATNLTSNRITFAGASGLLVDSSNFTINTGTGKVSITGELQVDNIDINGNTISINTASGNLVLTPGAASGFVSINDAYTLPRVDGTSTYVLTTDGSGAVTFQRNALRVTADSGSPSSVGILNDTLSIQGANGVATSVTAGVVTVSVSTASYSTKGIARFASADFVVTDGAVALATTGVTTGTFGSASSIPTITVNSKGQITSVTTSSIATSLNVAGSSGSTLVSLANSTLTFVGATSPITIAVTTNTVTVAVADATTSAKGLASFDATDFTVTAGAVTVNAERIQDIVGAMVSTNVESGISVTYDDPNGKLDFNVNDPVITIAGDVDGSATMTNLGDTTITVTLDTVNTTVGTFGGTTAIPIVTVNAKGLVTAVSTATISTTLNIAGGTGADAVALGSDTLTFAGNGAISTAVTNNQVAISVATATSSVKGVASFNAASFDVTTGDVTIKSAGVSNAQLVNSSVTVGTTSISLGASSTTLAGLTQVDVSNIRVAGNTVSSTDSNGDIVIDPNGTGTVNVSNARITNLADPTGAQDAATKAYVDATRSGLDVKASVRAATTVNITLTNTQTVDGVALSVGDRVLVKNQTTGSQNGIYLVASGAWTRSEDCDNTPGTEVTSGMFTFVEEGTANSDSGWVLTTDGAITLGTTSLVFVQFSGAGQITAGAGLSKTGNTLDVNVANGIEIVGDNVQLASSVAGTGLIYTTGVLNVVGTANRISVSADAIDISNSYTGQTSIVTIGEVSQGTWKADTVATTYGGTGRTTFNYGDILLGTTGSLQVLSMGLAGQVLQVNPTGNGVYWAELDGGTF